MEYVSDRPTGARLSRRRFLKASATAGIGAGVGWSAPSRAVRAQALNTLKTLSKPSPNTVVTDAGGRAVRLADYRPTPLLLNFWASWCAPCVHELPTLQSLDAALRRRGMAVMLVGTDRKGREFGAAFLEERGIDIPLALYDERRELARAFGVRAMPSSYLVGADGTVRGMVEGPEVWDDPAVVERVADLLS